MIRPAFLILAGLLIAASPAAKQPTSTEILAAAPATDWQQVDPADLVLIDLPNGKRAAMMLASALAPAHVTNIRALVRAHWFDGGSIYRLDDDYVVQWGQGDSDKKTPDGLDRPLPAEYERAAAGLKLARLPYRDPFAPIVGYAGAFPMAVKGGRAWTTHCYGIVGVARGPTPDTGNGGELYAVIGESPRTLDRNITLAGRMIDGFEQMARLPRGAGEMGFYEKPAERTPIIRVTIAADLPAALRPAYKWLKPESASYRKWLHAKASRQDDFFAQPAGAVDLCHGMPPVRPA